MVKRKGLSDSTNMVNEEQKSSLYLSAPTASFQRLTRGIRWNKDKQTLLHQWIAMWVHPLWDHCGSFGYQKNQLNSLQSSLLKTAVWSTSKGKYALVKYRYATGLHFMNTEDFTGQFWLYAFSSPCIICNSSVPPTSLAKRYLIHRVLMVSAWGTALLQLQFISDGKHIKAAELVLNNNNSMAKK